MTITAAARDQMAELKAHRSAAQAADLEADTADKLDSLQLFDHAFTTWRKSGQQVGRNGLVVGFDPDARAVKILEVTPEFEPCAACSRIPSGRRVETRMFTVAYSDITEIHRPEYAARDGWGLRLLGAVLDGRSVSSTRARQLLVWVDQLGEPAA